MRKKTEFYRLCKDIAEEAKENPNKLAYTLAYEHIEDHADHNRNVLLSLKCEAEEYNIPSFLNTMLSTGGLVFSGLSFFAILLYQFFDLSKHDYDFIDSLNNNSLAENLIILSSYGHIIYLSYALDILISLVIYLIVYAIKLNKHKYTATWRKYVLLAINEQLKELPQSKKTLAKETVIVKQTSCLQNKKHSSKTIIKTEQQSTVNKTYTKNQEDHNEK